MSTHNLLPAHRPSTLLVLAESIYELTRYGKVASLGLSKIQTLSSTSKFVSREGEHRISKSLNPDSAATTNDNTYGQIFTVRYYYIAIP
jgi:hypothetical protein